MTIHQIALGLIVACAVANGIIATCSLMARGRTLYSTNKQPADNATVVVPTRNTSPTRLNRLLEELKAQQRVSLQVLVIDESDPRYFDRLQLSLCGLTDVTLVRKDGPIGIAGSLRLGFERADTRLVVVVTDDVSFLSTDAIARVIGALPEEGAASCLLGSGGEYRWFHEFRRIKQLCFRRGFGRMMDLSNLSGAFWVAPKDLGIRLLPHTHFNEDYRFSKGLLQAGAHLRLVPEVLVSERERDNVLAFFRQQVRWRHGNLASAIEWVLVTKGREAPYRSRAADRGWGSFALSAMCWYSWFGAWVLPSLGLILWPTALCLSGFLVSGIAMCLPAASRRGMFLLKPLVCYCLGAPMQVLVTVAALVRFGGRRQLFYDDDSSYGNWDE